MPRRPVQAFETQLRAARHRQTRIAIALIALLSAVALTVVPAATASTSNAKHPRPPPARQGGQHVRERERRRRPRVRPGRSACAVVCLINQQRTSRHLPPLRASLLLDRSAQSWTNAMVSSDVFSHGTNFAARITAAGYVWRSAGENIATGFQTPRSVVNAWMASTGHCQNILNPTYGNVGTGVSRAPVRGWASGSGTWTQDFALSMFKSPPSGNYGPMDGCPY